MFLGQLRYLLAQLLMRVIVSGFDVLGVIDSFSEAAERRHEKLEIEQRLAAIEHEAQSE